MRNTTLLMLSVLLLTLPPLFLVSSARAEDGINLMDIPEQLGEKFGVSAFAGGLIATAILILIVMLPSAMLIRGKHAGMFMLIEGIALYSVCVAIAWTPAWTLIVLSMIIALMFSGNVREWLSGTGK